MHKCGGKLCTCMVAENFINSNFKAMNEFDDVLKVYSTHKLLSTPPRACFH